MWKSISELGYSPSSGRSHGDDVASMTWGARHFISAQVPRPATPGSSRATANHRPQETTPAKSSHGAAPSATVWKSNNEFSQPRVGVRNANSTQVGEALNAQQLAAHDAVKHAHHQVSRAASFSSARRAHTPSILLGRRCFPRRSSSPPLQRPVVTHGHYCRETFVMHCAIP